jgi:hypothetical protein
MGRPAHLAVTLKKLVREKRTGLLDIKGGQGFKARIYLANGEVVMVDDGKLFGAPAAKTIAKRLDLATEFLDNHTPQEDVPLTFSTAEFIGLLEKAESALDTFTRVIPSLDAVFALNKDSWGQEEVNPKDLQILMRLDGQRTVRQVIAEKKLPELDILHTIYRYHARGLVKRIAGAKPMAMEACRKLLADLQDRLADLIGPAAETLIDAALDAANASPDYLSKAELPVVLDALRGHLDADECEAFDRWVIAKGYGTPRRGSA